ncbi:MAG: MBL fold metallo-hydrolase [Deltaproteobacteria bacterium HGW-Deltaproteobacteria-21]|nr:MAG: MBL fold metallo-hydrolase [Deltaproteobacteria bacterium HGW-Deltaproteobacteria-21]
MEIINLGNVTANNYLLKIDGSLILIDTGYPGGFSAFCRKLQRNNINLSDINYVVLTHAHDDHAGFLNEVLEGTNAKLVLHEKAVERLQIGHNLWIGGCPNLTAKVFVVGMGLFGKGRHEYPRVTIPRNAITWDTKTQPFEEISIPLHLIALPGHTADSIGVICEDESIFCGDAAMNQFPSIHRNIIWIENIEEYRKSWDRMILTKTKYIYPSHGKPFMSRDLEKYRNELERIKIRKVKSP